MQNRFLLEIPATFVLDNYKIDTTKYLQEPAKSIAILKIPCGISLEINWSGIYIPMEEGDIIRETVNEFYIRTDKTSNEKIVLYLSSENTFWRRLFNVKAGRYLSNPRILMDKEYTYLLVDNIGRLRIKAEDELSLLNSYFLLPSNAFLLTTTPLAANETYISPIFDFEKSRLRHISALAYSDQPSATNGFWIEQSLDGENWDYIGLSVTVNANQATALEQAVIARYVRIVYQNSSQPQTVFRLGGRCYI